MALACVCALTFLGVSGTRYPAYADEPTGPEATESDEATPSAPADAPQLSDSPESASGDEAPVPAPPVSAPAATAMAGAIRVEESHSMLSHTGTWRSVAGAGASGGGYRYSSVAGTGVTLYFRGSAVALIGPVGPTYGRVGIWLDGVRVATASQYSPA